MYFLFANLLPIAVFFIPTVFFILINPGNEPLWSTIMTAVMYTVVSAPAAYGVNILVKKIFRRLFSDRTSNNLNIEKLNEWDLLDSAVNTISNNETYSFSLQLICNKLGIDPEEAKVGLGKAKGGGNTYIGFGSGRAIGIGIGLSAGSATWSGLKNAGVNLEISDLENYIFYDNVAMYFNDEIMPQL